jgi:hypothetical protein
MQARGENKMRFASLSAVGLFLALAVPAVAQTSTPSTGSTQSVTGQQTPKMSANTSDQTQANAGDQSAIPSGTPTWQNKASTQATTATNPAGSNSYGTWEKKSLTQANADNETGSSAARQNIIQDLEQAGFTKIQVMPESFLVRAQDKEGRPMMMVVNPDSVFAISEANPGNTNGSQHNASDIQNNGSATTTPTAK